MQQRSPLPLSKRKFLTLCATTLGSLTLSNLSHAKTNNQSLNHILSEHNGKVILFDFWASWCIPCRKSFPWLNDIAKRYNDQGLVVIGINVDEHKGDAEKFLAEIPANFDILYDPDGTHAKQYDIKVMPSSLLFNRSGTHVSTHAGFLSKKTQHYENQIEALLNS